MSIKNRLQDEIPNIDLKSLQLLLDERKASYILGVSLSLLRKSRCEGAIRNRTPGPPFVNVGGRVYYRPADLKAWVEGLVGKEVI